MEGPQEASEEAETGSTVPAESTRRTCPFCGASLTFDSLLTHMDRFVREQDPKAPDGVHNPAEIRRLRGTNARLAKKRPFPFLKLPAELRNRIYEIQLNRGRENDIVWRADTMSICYSGLRFTMRSCYTTALRPTLTSRQIESEFSSLFYGQNRFYFYPYDVWALFRFLMNSGPERCQLIRHVGLRRFNDNSPEAAQENLIPTIKTCLGSVPCSPWNDQKAYRSLLSTLWESRKTGELQPGPQHTNSWYRAAFGRDDRIVKYLLLYGRPGPVTGDFQLPPGWARGVDKKSRRCFSHTDAASGCEDRVIYGSTLARFADELGDTFYENKDISLDMP